MYFFKLFLSLSLFSLFSLSMYESKIIKNIDVVSCRNCMYYKPESYNNFYSDFNKCIYFGTKNIQTNIIDYELARTCRSDEEKCGYKGLYFQENTNVEFKIFMHNLILKAPFNFSLLLLFLYFYNTIYILKKN